MTWDIKKWVTKAYYPLFKSKKRYIVYKGSRGSGKSVGIAISIIYKIMTEPYVNWLVVRQFQTTQKDSTYANIKWAAYFLGVESMFKFTTSPLEITYKATGQKIFFRGLDDPLKITSIKAPIGNICRVFYEEAYELKSVDDFKTVEESIRGILPDGGYYQTVVAFNPWSEKHWLKGEFFDKDTRERNTLAMTTTYKDNEHLDDDYIDMLMTMKEKNPNRARVAVDGEWGIADGLIFDGLFKLEDFDYKNINGKKIMGLDFGFTHDPTAFIKAIVSGGDIYIYDGFYKHGMLNEPMAREIAKHGGTFAKIYADSAEPRTIAELKSRGLSGVIPVGKGKDSNKQRYEFMKSYHYHIHPSCAWLFEEMSTKVYKKDKTSGKDTNEPEDGDDHAIQALGYALEPLIFTNKNGKYMTYQERVNAVKSIGLTR